MQSKNSIKKAWKNNINIISNFNVKFSIFFEIVVFDSICS